MFWKEHPRTDLSTNIVFRKDHRRTDLSTNIMFWKEHRRTDLSTNNIFGRSIVELIFQRIIYLEGAS